MLPFTYSIRFRGHPRKFFQCPPFLRRVSSTSIFPNILTYKDHRLPYSCIFFSYFFLILLIWRTWSIKHRAILFTFLFTTFPPCFLSSSLTYYVTESNKCGGDPKTHFLDQLSSWWALTTVDDQFLVGRVSLLIASGGRWWRKLYIKAFQFLLSFSRVDFERKATITKRFRVPNLWK